MDHKNPDMDNVILLHRTIRNVITWRMAIDNVVVKWYALRSLRNSTPPRINMVDLWISRFQRGPNNIRKITANSLSGWLVIRKSKIIDDLSWKIGSGNSRERGRIRFRRVIDKRRVQWFFVALTSTRLFAFVVRFGRSFDTRRVSAAANYEQRRFTRFRTR